MKKEVKTMPTYNPFSGEYENLICGFELDVDRTGKTMEAALVSIKSNEGDEILDYLATDKIINDIEAEFLRGCGK